jgi:hypothetical protein
MYRFNKKETGSKPSNPLARDKSTTGSNTTKLTIKMSRSSKQTKFGKEKNDRFSFIYERKSQPKAPKLASKKSLSQYGNRTQFWLGIVINFVISLIFHILRR